MTIKRPEDAIPSLLPHERRAGTLYLMVDGSQVNTRNKERKGARISNMVIFLGSWAALKIPQLMVEIKFLGIVFTSLRFVLTLAALVLVGILMELLLRIKPDKAWLENLDAKAIDSTLLELTLFGQVLLRFVGRTNSLVSMSDYR
ncbi:MAG: hypothetical protein Q7J85_15205 [Bacillota bacterium]|nr:hypothetical protein [Bacillota bacterium]